MNEIDFLSSEILNRYGNIKRARGNFLYTEKSVRLTDLYRQDGRAILGWGAEGTSAFTVLKDVLQRGLTGSFPTTMSYRLEKAVSDLLLSKRKVFAFGSKEEAVRFALQVSSQNTAVYKPWAVDAQGAAVDFSQSECVVLEPPLPFAQGTTLLAIKEECKANFDSALHLPPVMQAAFARSVYDLISCLKELREKDFFVYDKALTKYFLRKGPYLFPKVSQEEYNSFVKFCLDCKIVINPYYNRPSIVPFKADAGVFSELKKRNYGGQ